MEVALANEAIRLGGALTEVAAKTTGEWVNTKIRQAREKKEIKTQQQVYEEIITELLTNKNELQRIADEYRQLYEKVTISDEDIEYLQSTLKQTINLVSKFMPNLGDQKDNLDLLIDLLNKDTLKTMQLLGFNYKQAIGEPLTEVVSSMILTKVNMSKNPQKRK
ncbi:hypothetical protein [Jeotgalibaca arthritidis]|uniref:Uncharacterized protein n=1 Tax=Jeotgalibaca arthritidis TaxID=1868794 RepID=A0A6G7K8Y6_9LACT|nr:hypothetical protein [Jeotgalibaca arthritidis]QII81723.1 hypothetical protein G7057_04030 [Jeotgalibaca arthritidis]